MTELVGLAVPWSRRGVEARQQQRAVDWPDLRRRIDSWLVVQLDKVERSSIAVEQPILLAVALPPGTARLERK